MKPLFTCPYCSHPLPQPRGEGVRCPSCGVELHARLGILDLRGPRAPSPDPDWEVVAALQSEFENLDYAGLLKLRLRLAPSAGDLLGHEQDYHLQQFQRGRNMVSMFRRRLEECYGPGLRGNALDLGCGAGAATLALAEGYDWVVGLDASLPNLILAKKALQGAGARNCLLVNAYAQHLPLVDGQFAHITAVNVAEHVADLGEVVAECRRVLGSRGTLAFDSRNRFDLLFPEPHVRLRWVGFLPRAWAKAYVRRRRHVEYSSTALLSLHDLARAMQDSFGNHYRVVFPEVTAYGHPAWQDGVLRSLERLPLLRGLLMSFFPSHLVLAQKEP